MTDIQVTILNSQSQEIVPQQSNSTIVYRDVPGFPGYRVGTDGSVWSCRKSGTGYGKTKEWMRLKPCSNTNGRLAVTLRRDRRPYRRQIHRLVMFAFVGPCPEGMEVCHENGDHTNNRLSNLRYDTHIGNESDKIKHGRKLLGDRHPIAKLNAEKVRAIKKSLLDDRRHGIIARLARENEVDEAIIARIRDGAAWRWVV